MSLNISIIDGYILKVLYIHTCTLCVVNIFCFLVGNTDYMSGPYDFTFTAGVTSVLFNISLIDDNIIEDNETFYLAIEKASLPDKVTVEDTSSHSTVNIESDDCKLLLHFATQLCVQL